MAAHQLQQLALLLLAQVQAMQLHHMAHLVGRELAQLHRQAHVERRLCRLRRKCRPNTPHFATRTPSALPTEAQNHCMNASGSAKNF